MLVKSAAVAPGVGQEQRIARKSSRVIKDERSGLTFERYFTRQGVDPFETVEWERRDAVISGADGKVFFEQRGVEFPKTWSQTATNVVVQKYFRGTLGTPDRENSVRQMIGRVADTMYGWGKADGYFKSEQDAWAFRDELVHLLLHQKMAFNSPVWFNVGVEEHPQCSACFINSVDDSMSSILGLAKTEGMLFKYGSGTGSNLSSLRSSREHLNGGGTASGPVSFMRGFDAFAGAIKSGGKTRRAAKMVILNVEHPDIVDFVDCKAIEEKKAWTLIDAGYDGGFNVVGGAYDSVNYQNANHSVRVTDDFMNAVLRDSDWSTKSVTNGTFQRQTGLGEFQEPVAVGVPGKAVDGSGVLIEAVHFQRRRRFGHHLVGRVQQPAAQGGSCGGRVERRVWGDAIQLAKSRGVPQLGDEAAVGLDPARTKLYVPPRPGQRADREAQRVGAVTLDEVERVQHVALGLAHLLAAFIAH